MTVGPIAQLVEQQTFNLLVVGSSPTRPTQSFHIFNLFFCRFSVFKIRFLAAIAVVGAL